MLVELKGLSNIHELILESNKIESIYSSCIYQMGNSNQVGSEIGKEFEDSSIMSLYSELIPLNCCSSMSKKLILQDCHMKREWCLPNNSHSNRVQPNCWVTDLVMNLSINSNSNEDS